ncbi:MAG: hypothetical protein WCO60_20065 [Verrucomicrobiota bacterium]
MSTNLIPSFGEIETLTVQDKSALFADMSRLSNRAFSTCGKIYFQLDTLFQLEDKDKPRQAKRTVTATLKAAGISESTISNSAPAAKMWRDLVAPGHLDEADYDTLAYRTCLAAQKAMSAKSKLILSPAEAADLIRTSDDPEADFRSMFESGRSAAEEAYAKQQAKAAQDAAKIKANTAPVAAQPPVEAETEAAPVVAPPAPSGSIAEKLAAIQAENAALIAAQSAPSPVTESPESLPEPTPFPTVDNTAEVLAAIDRLEAAIATLPEDGQMAVWERLTATMNLLVSSLEHSVVAA